MPNYRAILGSSGICLLMALFLAGCSGADSGGSQSAAAQADAAVHLSTSGFRIDSPHFQERVRPYVRIPEENTCYGENVSPNLEWAEAPEGTQSLALVAEDADHHTGTWVLWVLYNIPSDTTGLPEAISTSTEVLPDGTTQGTNDNKNIGYEGPCPPALVFSMRHTPSGAVGDPPHRFYFRLYALDTDLALASGATRNELLSAMDGHILAQANTMGKYTTPRIVKETFEMKESLTQTPLAGPSPTPAP